MELPLAPTTQGAVPMDAETAAAYGLTEKGPARAQGLLDRFGRSHTYLRISVPSGATYDASTACLRKA